MCLRCVFAYTVCVGVNVRRGGSTSHNPNGQQQEETCACKNGIASVGLLLPTATQGLVKVVLVVPSSTLRFPTVFPTIQQLSFKKSETVLGKLPYDLSSGEFTVKVSLRSISGPVMQGKIITEGCGPGDHVGSLAS